MNWFCIDFRTWSLACGMACLCLCLSLAGCGGGGAPAGGAKPGASGAAVAGKPGESSEVDDTLKSILDMLKLESLGFTSSEDGVVGLVNQWQRSTMDKDSFKPEEPLDAATLAKLKEYLSEEHVALLRRTAFNSHDIEHIRDLLLMSASYQGVTANAKTDLERAANLFHNIVRNSDLIANREDDLPLSLFHAYLLGKMTVSERAWLFSELLRQLKIDCVILTAAGSQTDTADKVAAWDATKPFLMGVLVNKQVHLFDPRLGLPITAPTANGGTPAIATLAQAQSDPKILQQYDLEPGKSYAITSAMLQTPRVLVCGSPCMWSYRFQRLQVAFTGDRYAVISDSLLDRDDQVGLISRVTSWHSKPWQPNQIGVWSFPGQQLLRLSSLSPEQKAVLERMIDPLKMPLKAKEVTVKGVKQEVRTTTSQFLVARMDHVRGNLQDAVKGYSSTLTRLQNPNFAESLPQRSRVAYLKAEEDTRFWIAVCKLNQETKNDAKIAADKLRLYLRTYPQGEWTDASHALLATILAAGGDFATAAEEVSKISPEHPQIAGFDFQKRIWLQGAK